MPMTKLTQQDIENIDSWRMEYMGDYREKNLAPLEDVLKFWEQNKAISLYKLFGEKLILERQFEYEESTSALMDKLFQERKKMEDFKYLYNTLVDWYVAEENAHPFERHFNVEKWAIVNLFDTQCQVMGEFRGELPADGLIHLPNGKSIKIEQGSKPLKMIGKIVAAFDDDKLKDAFENYRLMHSRVLNTKKQTGTMCLSIHPLDYITMSDNNSKWQSCMNWRHNGCYRRGTVEMMNSENVIVAYLRSNKGELILPNGNSWNNKKWRSLYIFDEDFITNVKDYPYFSEKFDTFILEWLRELAQENLGISYSEVKDWEYPYIPNTEKELLFETDAMYNDFENDSANLGVFNYENIANWKSTRTCEYSGPDICFCCGGSCNCYEDESYVICEDCVKVPYSYCRCCGDPLWNEEDILRDDTGNCFCEDCFESSTVVSELDGNRYWRSELNTVIIVPDEFEELISPQVLDSLECKLGVIEAFDTMKVHNSYLPGGWYGQGEELPNKYFEPDTHVKRRSQGWSSYLYVSAGSLTREGKKLYLKKDIDMGKYRDLIYDIVGLTKTEEKVAEEKEKINIFDKLFGNNIFADITSDGNYTIKF